MAEKRPVSLTKTFLGVFLAVVAGGLVITLVLDPLMSGSETEPATTDLQQQHGPAGTLPQPHTRVSPAATHTSSSPMAVEDSFVPEKAVVESFRRFVATFAVELNARTLRMTVVPPAGIDVVRTDSLVSPFEGRLTTSIRLERLGAVEQFEVQSKFRWAEGRWHLVGEAELFEGAENTMSLGGRSAAGFLSAYAKPAADAAAARVRADGETTVPRSGTHLPRGQSGAGARVAETPVLAAEVDPGVDAIAEAIQRSQQDRARYVHAHQQLNAAVQRSMTELDQVGVILYRTGHPPTPLEQALAKFEPIFQQHGSARTTLNDQWAKLQPQIIGIHDAFRRLTPEVQHKVVQYLIRQRVLPVERASQGVARAEDLTGGPLPATDGLERMFQRYQSWWANAHIELRQWRLADAMRQQAADFRKVAGDAKPKTPEQRQLKKMLDQLPEAGTRRGGNVERARLDYEYYSHAAAYFHSLTNPNWLAPQRGSEEER